MPIRLVPLDSSAGLPTIIVDRPIILVGRHGECDVQIRSSKVSRKHCCLAEVDGEEDTLLAVRDLDSTNGTRINGDIVSGGRLKEGDELTIGAFQFKVVMQPTAIHPTDPLASAEFPVPLLEPRDSNILDSRPKQGSDAGAV